MKDILLPSISGSKAQRPKTGSIFILTILGTPKKKSRPNYIKVKISHSVIVRILAGLTENSLPISGGQDDLGQWVCQP
jgi:hypothetical protein